MWVDVCTLPSDPCSVLVTAIGNKLSPPPATVPLLHGCEDPGWVTSVVYEVCAYSVRGRFSSAENATLVCREFPRKLLRAMKRRLGAGVLPELDEN